MFKRQDIRFAVKHIVLSFMLLFGLVGCVPSGGTANSQSSGAEDRGTVYDPPKPIADFTLMSHTGKPLRFSELQGRPVLVFFGFTHCPDVCPLTLQEWTKIKTDLGAEADKVSFVFISVDGARDSPAVLAKYVASYDPSFVGLTGDEGMVLSIARDFGSYANIPTTKGDTYDVMHGTYSFLVNEQGELQKVYSYGMASDVITKDLKAMLNS